MKRLVFFILFFIAGCLPIRHELKEVYVPLTIYSTTENEIVEQFGIPMDKKSEFAKDGIKVVTKLVYELHEKKGIYYKFHITNEKGGVLDSIVSPHNPYGPSTSTTFSFTFLDGVLIGVYPGYYQRIIY